MKHIGKFEGQVSEYDVKKGFGFITVNDQAIKDDAFVHYKEILTTKNGFKKLLAGQKVELELYRCETGLRACQVVIIGNVFDSEGDISGNT